LILLLPALSYPLVLYGIKLHMIERFLDTSLNYINTYTGIVVHWKEIDFLGLHDNPLPNGVAINPDPSNGGLYVLLNGANRLPTLHWPYLSTMTWSQYGLWTNTLVFDNSTSTLFGSWFGNGTIIAFYKVNPTTGASNLFTKVPGFSVTSIATDSNFNVYVVGSQIALLGPSYLSTFDTRSDKVVTSFVTESVSILGIGWDAKRSALVGIASMSTGNVHFVHIDPSTAKVVTIGDPIKVQFTKNLLIGPAINPETDSLWFMGQVEASDTLFSIDMSNGNVASSVSLHYVDGGTLTSLFWSVSVL